MSSAEGAQAAGRPVLGAGRGRIIAFAIAAGAVLPVAILRRHADAPVARWADLQRSAEGARFWEWAGVIGAPAFWLSASVIGFGVAAGLNWNNTARWMGVLALGVLWAGLANIAVAGEARGTATTGVVACMLVLWQPRGWPIWSGLAAILAIARMIATGAPASATIVSVLLGVLGVLVVEFAWYTVAPDAPPRRGADPRS